MRREYMKAMVAQDVAFFDAAQAGELSAATSEKVQEVQNGTAKKLGEFIQALFTGVGGLAVGFYFSWKLSLVILAGVPLMAAATYMLVQATTKLTQANPAGPGQSKFTHTHDAYALDSKGLHRGRGSL